LATRPRFGDTNVLHDLVTRFEHARQQVERATKLTTSLTVLRALVRPEENKPEALQRCVRDLEQAASEVNRYQEEVQHLAALMLDFDDRLRWSEQASVQDNIPKRSGHRVVLIAGFMLLTLVTGVGLWMTQ
jgi:hypothetical protein